MTDRIKVLKLEQPTDGTQYDPFPTEANPNEDYIAIKGISFEDREDIIIESVANQIRFRDAVVPPITLNELINLSQSGINFNYKKITGTLTIPTNQQMIVYGDIEILGDLYIDGDLILTVW